jgi:putative transposase
MNRRIPASMRTRESLSALIEEHLSSRDSRSELVKLATRLILEEALEAEARDAMGRDYDERGAEDGRGYRNGHRFGRLKLERVALDRTRPEPARGHATARGGRECARRRAAGTPLA